MAKITIAQTPDQYEQKPQNHFIKSDFDAFVWDKGYKVYHDKMIICPCKTEENTHRASCPNCRGFGYALYKRVETRMALQAMNYDTKFKDWSMEKVGTVKITAQPDADLCHMDRIILLEGESTFNEVIYPKVYKSKLFSWLTYNFIRDNGVFLYPPDSDPDGELIPLQEGVDFTVDGTKFLLNDSYLTNEGINNFKISIRYVYQPQFHIIDNLRDIINADTLEYGTMLIEDKKFPVHAIGRRSHLELLKPNYDGNNINDNTQ